MFLLAEFRQIYNVIGDSKKDTQMQKLHSRAQKQFGAQYFICTIEDEKYDCHLNYKGKMNIEGVFFFNKSNTLHIYTCIYIPTHIHTTYIHRCIHTHTRMCVHSAITPDLGFSPFHGMLNGLLGVTCGITGSLRALMFDVHAKSTKP